jgi:hypothetical protein
MAIIENVSTLTISIALGARSSIALRLKFFSNLFDGYFLTAMHYKLCDPYKFLVRRLLDRRLIR